MSMAGPQIANVRSESRLLRLLDDWLAPRPDWQILFLAVLLISAVAAADYVTGFEVSSSIFYLFPVALSAWYVGRRAGVAICVLSALVWVSVDSWTGHTYSDPRIPYWNASVRFGFFVIVTLLLDALRNALHTHRELATIDGLTGLRNARSFRYQAQLVLAGALRRRAPVALAYLDLDGFKAINDSRGHDAGDEILRAVGEQLSRAALKGDLVARMGGDEFAILRDSTDLNAAESGFAELHRLLQRLAGEQQWPIGFSLGVAVFARAPESVDAALRAADRLMYRVKSSGKNRLEVEAIAATMPALGTAQ